MKKREKREKEYLINEGLKRCGEERSSHGYVRALMKSIVDTPLESEREI